MVLSIAAETFSEEGYRSATMETIASKVGIHKGSLYHYVDNKEDLLFEILKRRAHERLDVLAENEDTRALPSPDRLTIFIRKWMQSTKVTQQGRSLSETETRFLKSTRKAEIQALHRRIGGVAFDIIQTGITDGSFDSTVNPYVATRSLFQLLFTIGRWYPPDGLTNWDDFTEWYVRLMLGGLTSQDFGELEARLAP